MQGYNLSVVLFRWKNDLVFLRGFASHEMVCQHLGMRLTTLLVALVAALCIIACQSSDNVADTVATSSPSKHPNIIVVVVDDLRWDELGIAGHAYLETPNIDRLAHEGAMFTSAFHAVPLCSPNRASILTGQYPSRHGIIDNVARNRASHHLRTFPQALQKAGYETAFLGKWHMGNDSTPRPGFDYWVAIPGQGRSEDPELYEDGRLHTVEGYLTDILTERAVAFIERDRDTPFCLYIGQKAIHPDIQQRDDGSAGEVVKQNDKLATLEAMKMQSTIYAPKVGTVTRIFVQPGEEVEAKDLLLEIER